MDFCVKATVKVLEYRQIYTVAEATSERQGPSASVNSLALFKPFMVRWTCISRFWSVECLSPFRHGPLYVSLHDVFLSSSSSGTL